MASQGSDRRGRAESASAIQIGLDFSSEHTADLEARVHVRCRSCGTQITLPRWYVRQGVKHHFCGRRCLQSWGQDQGTFDARISLSGRPNHRGGNWERQASRARARDGYRCRVCGAPEEDQDRRLEAVEKLKNYLDDEIASSSEKDYIVAGDWNDELDDPAGSNVFLAFLQDPTDYQFLTASLVGKQQDASYPRYGSLIDHILISQDAFAEYEAGYTETLRLDEEVDGYSIEVSDHRPVMAVFPVFGK